jgi:predicted regulator of Ras-like GTPase activity (Roadblock/LC7/MglB family)
MLDFVLTAKALREAQETINSLIKAGVRNAMLIDSAGNVLVNCGHDPQAIDATSLAALAAPNIGATAEIARLIGEDDFSLLFHKGKQDSIHFSRIGDDLILITIFRDNISLGLVRYRVSELSQSIRSIFAS